MLVGGGLDVVQCGDEIIENLCGHHDGITIPSDIFSDFHDEPACVAFQIEEKNFPIRKDFFCV